MRSFTKEVGEEESRYTKEVSYTKWLFELSNKDVNIAGGKGASLAEMYNNKFPVPPAFIITAQAFEKFISKIKDEIGDVIKKTDVDDTTQLNQNSKKIRELIEKQKIPEEMEKEILEAYETLGAEKKDLRGVSEDALNILKVVKEPVFVAVRSSATTEDLISASFAGQQETFLNIKGKEALIEAVKKCFSSLYTPRAIYYREKRGFSHSEALLAIVVQKMICSEKSGVMFTKNPIHDDNNIVIEAVFGLGEGIVSGKIKPDNYAVNRELEILEKNIADKKKALVRSGSGETEEVKLTEQKSNQQVLTDGEIARLADYGLQIEKHYKKPQDIEFAIENREIYIVQSRPITTSAKGKARSIEGKVLLQGLAASPGVATGVVKIVKSMKDLEKVKKGDILVTEMTNPDMVVTMQKSDAIITDEGGATSHAAIVSREMGIVCVVGTRQATKLLKEGQIVTVDGGSGKVYEGEVGKEKKEEILPIVETKTKIKVIIDLPDFAERASRTLCKDVGLLRLEGIIAESGKHPLMFLAESRVDAYSKIIEKGVGKIAEHFEGIWVRTSDIRTDEFKNLQGSPKEQETNPMLGFHGIRFSLKNKAILEAELQAIKNIAEKFPKKQLGVMFPQIISIEEVKEAKKIFEKFKENNMKFGIMVETPAACEIIEDLCKEGIDFISFGTNDLTQYTLAVDRGNKNVQDIYNEMHPAVLRQIKKVIKVCKEKGVDTSICGQAASRLEMAKFLVEEGIDSISVNADAAYDISKLVREIEQKTEGKIKKEKTTEEEQPVEKIEEKKEKPEEKKQEQLEKKEQEEPEEKEAEEEKEKKAGEVEEIDNLKCVEEKIEDIKEEVERKKGKKEFPDIDVDIDVFNPSSSEEKIAGTEIPRAEPAAGSIVTEPKKREEFPPLGIEFDFLGPAEMISGAILEKTEEKIDKEEKKEDEYVLDIF